MKTTKITVECWNCETNYDYAKHEVCPVCERHWLDSRLKEAPPEPGNRLSVAIDHTNNRLRTIPALLLVILLSITGCSSRSTPHCPTYARTTTPVDASVKYEKVIGWVSTGLFVVWVVIYSRLSSSSSE